jgi:hypothetical protein
MAKEKTSMVTCFYCAKRAWRFCSECGENICEDHMVMEPIRIYGGGDFIAMDFFPRVTCKECHKKKENEP